MKKNDLLKYFLLRSDLFTIKDEEVCGDSIYNQIFDVFDCEYNEIFVSSKIVSGDYLVTNSPKGLNPTFCIVSDEFVRYFTLIEEE